MDWGKTLIEATTIALISVCGAVLAALLVNILFGSRVMKRPDDLKLDKEHSQLKGEHDNLSTEHQNLSAGHRRLEESTRRTELHIDNIRQSLTEEKARQDMRYATMMEKQQDAIDHLRHLQTIGDELRRVQNENTELRQQIAELRRQSHRMREAVEQEDYDIDIR